ncbi:MAG: ATP-binding protein [Anaerolineae bacterium]
MNRGGLDRRNLADRPGHLGSRPAFGQRCARLALAAGLRSATGIPIIKDGVTVRVMIFFSRSAWPLEERLLTTLTDLGRQIGQFLACKEAEESLRRFEYIVSTSSDWLSLIDRTYTYQIVNQTYLTLFNKPLDQTIGHSVAELSGEAWFNKVIKPRLDQALAGEPVHFQKWFDFPAAGQRFNDVTYTPYWEKDGTISGVLVSGRDITEAKLLEEHLQQVQKMGAIGQLAAGMAHHYNSMLTAIIGFTSLSLRTLPPGDPVAKNLERVLGTAERMAVLVRQLLAFAQKQLLQFKTANLNDLVRQLQGELKQMAPPPIEFTLDLAPEAGQVKVDLHQFEYLLRALVSNAVDAMPAGGSLTLTTRNVSLGPIEAGWYELPPGDYVLLTVQDTGIGLTDEVKAHLFEPFFTTKEVGQGMGLGLAMSLGIARQHGGHLLAEGQPGQGAIFMLYLPLVAPPPPPVSPAPATDFTTILLVEAAPGVRKLMTEILTKEGYPVLAAADSPTALQLVTDHPERWPHLLLTPADLPGRSLAQHLRASHPGLKVIFVVDQGEEGTEETETVTFLAKPFKPSNLLQKVWAMLA